MAKSTTNGNGAAVTNGCAITPTIHLVLQGKGGVGKTVVAGWLAEFLIHRGQPVHCIDGDPVNRSLAQYKALPVEKLDLVNQDGVVMRSRYDALVDRFVNEEAVFVVDNGATAFLPFWTYVVESNIPAVLREVLLPDCLYLRRTDFSVAADQRNPERQRSGGDDSVGQIRHFGSLDELQRFCYKPVQRHQHAWPCGIV
jgi:hypothetical protein